MDPEKLKQFADAQFERSAYLKSLRETAHANLTVAHNGGLFLVNPTLICFLSAYSESEMYLEDTYNNPILVDREKLLYQAKEVYSEVMKSWAEDFNKSNQIRRASNV